MPNENEAGLVEISGDDLRRMSEGLSLDDMATQPEPVETPSDGPAEEAQQGEPEPETEQVPENGSDEPEAGDDTEEKKPPVDKRQKERERRDRSWKALNERKAEFKAQQEAFEKERAEYLAKQAEQQFQPQADQPEPATDGPSAEDYEALAKEYEAEGRDDMAEFARSKAVEAEAKGRPAKPVNAGDHQQMQAAYNANLQKVIADNRDLQDPNSALYKGVAEVMQARPMFRQYVEGPQDAVQFVKTRMAAERVGELEASLAEKESLIEELNRKLTPSGGEGGEPSGEKSFEDMDPDERARFLRKAAGELDRTMRLA